MGDWIDSVHTIGADHVSVHSVPRFWEYLDEITPKALRKIPGIGDTYLGLPIREDIRTPPGQVWFFHKDGQFIGAVDTHPEPPEMA